MPTVFNKWNQQKSIKQAVLPIVFWLFFLASRMYHRSPENYIATVYSCSSFGVEFEDLVLFSYLAILE